MAKKDEIQTSSEVDSPGSADSGLIAFATLLALHRIAVDPEQLCHDLGHHDCLTADDLLRLAKREDSVRARRIVASWDGLASLPLPALANGPHGWFLIGKAAGDNALIQRPGCLPNR
jgi:subfamily B ATP-binding cassette protein HlyB/CyaB